MRRDLELSRLTWLKLLACLILLTIGGKVSSQSELLLWWFLLIELAWLMLLTIEKTSRMSALERIESLFLRAWAGLGLVSRRMVKLLSLKDWKLELLNLSRLARLLGTLGQRKISS